jgi:hypothetical protein
MTNDISYHEDREAPPAEAAGSDLVAVLEVPLGGNEPHAVQFLQEGGAHLNTMRGLRVQILNFSGKEYLILVCRVSTGTGI